MQYWSCFIDGKQQRTKIIRICRTTSVLSADLNNDFCSIAINYVVNTYDFPLKAAQHGAKECVHWLLQKRASPNVRDGKSL